MKKKILDWSDIERAVERLAENIKLSGREFDAISGLPRGGLIPAVMLSHKLNLPYVDFSGEAEDFDKVLLVDDICDSGETLKKHHPYFTLVSIHYKSKAVIEPDFWYKLVDEEDWVVYPWEDKSAYPIPDYKL